MVNVSVTAVSLIFPGIENPGPQDMFPSVPWMILALIGGKILMQLGVTDDVGDLLGVGIVLELGPMLTAIIMTGA